MPVRASNDEGGGGDGFGTLHVKVKVRFPNALSADAEAWARTALPDD